MIDTYLIIKDLFTVPYLEQFFARMKKGLRAHNILLVIHKLPLVVHHLDAARKKVGYQPSKKLSFRERCAKSLVFFDP